VHRGGCLELYYCNMVEWFWWDSSLISTTNWFLSVTLTLLVKLTPVLSFYNFIMLVLLLFQLSLAFVNGNRIYSRIK